MPTRTLFVQTYIPAIRNLGTGEVLTESRWNVCPFRVESSVDERGVEFLAVDGVRFALAYKIGEDTTACGLENPELLPRGKAQDIGRLMWRSGTGVGAPSKRGTWVE